MSIRRRTVSFIVALLVLVAVYAPTLKRLTFFSLNESSESYILIAPAITLYLIWISRKEIFRTIQSSFLSASVFAAAGLAAVFLAHRYMPLLGESDFFSLTALSFCLFIAGVFLACFGQSAFKAAIFPLAMLLFFVPLPSEASKLIIAWLQSGSAALVDWSFSLLHVPVLREGLVFTVPGVSIEIAAECSGINSSIALLITALLIAHETFRVGVNRTIFVLLSIPLSIVKNAIRIVTLTLLATYVDMSFLTGPLHHRGGFVFFLIALALMVPIWRVLKKREDSLIPTGQTSEARVPLPSFPTSR